MVSATELVRAAAAAGLRVLAVTDHDNFGAIPEAREAGLRFGVEVVAGEEVTTDKPARVHVVGLFLDGPVRMGMPVVDTVRAIHDQGAWRSSPIPSCPPTSPRSPPGLRRLISRQRVDGIELRHTAVTTASRIRDLDAFYELHQDRLGAAIGSSDSHFGAHDLARTVTLFPGSTAADLRRAIEARQTIPLEKYRQPAGPALTTRLRQQARSMGWLAWQRWRGKIGREGA